MYLGDREGVVVYTLPILVTEFDYVPNIVTTIASLLMYSILM